MSWEGNEMINRNIRSAVITGPTGAIGTALCGVLLENGVEVYAVCRPGSARTDGLPQNERLHIVRCDAAELDKLPERIRGPVDAFFHFAWAHTIGPGRNDMSAQIQNIRYTIDAVHAAEKLGCRVFLGAGSQAEYGRVEGKLTPETPAFPENGYGMAKLCAGQMSRVECAKTGMDHIWMRILSIYGPRDGQATMISSTIRALLAGERPALTAGEQLWDYLYSEDVARAFWLAAEHGVSGSVYPVGSGKVMPLREYVEILRDCIDPALPLGFGEIPYSPLQVMHLQADISTLNADTGFVPKIEFREGIIRTIAWNREQLEEKTP